MSLQIKCGKCATQLAVKKELLGKRIKCPKCQSVLAIKAPAPLALAASPVAQTPASSMMLKCGCGTTLKVPSSAAGKTVNCPKCRRSLRAPQAGISTPTPVAKPVANTPASPPNLGVGPAGDVSWGALPSAPASGRATSFPPAAATPNPYARKPNASKKPKKSNAKAAKTKQPKASSRGPDRDWFAFFGNRIHLAMLICLFAGPCTVFVSLRTEAKQKILKERGKTVSGIVTDGEEVHRRRSHTYKLTIKYTADASQIRSQEFDVGSTFYRNHDIGSRVQVRYDPQDSGNALLVGQESNAFAGMLFGMALSIFGVIGTGYIVFVDDIEF